LFAERKRSHQFLTKAERNSQKPHSMYFCWGKNAFKTLGRFMCLKREGA